MDKRNEDLDEFFKEKLTSEGSAHPFDQNDWNLLEQKLDLREKKRKQNVFLFGTLILSAAASLIIFYFWMIKSNELILSQPQDVLSMSHKYHEASVLTKGLSSLFALGLVDLLFHVNITSLALTKNSHLSKPGNVPLLTSIAEKFTSKFG